MLLSGLQEVNRSCISNLTITTKIELLKRLEKKVESGTN